MKKSISNFSSVLIILFLLINIFKHPNYVSKATELAFNIWKNNLFPFLFPMFVLSEIIMHTNLINVFNKIGEKFIPKLFNVSNNATFIIVMSMLSGFPSSAKYISSMYKQEKLSINDANKILLFTHFSNPLFIIGTIASNFLGSAKLAIIIFLSHYTTNFIIGIICRKYNPIKKEKTIGSVKMITQKDSQIPSFGNILANAISNSINTLLLILGTISVFLLLTTIFNNTFNLGDIGNAIFNGIIEMSQGLKYISLLDIPLRIKVTMTVMVISFGGLSIHLQIISILSDIKIKYTPFLLSRIVHAIIAGLIAFLLFPLLV